jgi:TonB family protein
LDAGLYSFTAMGEPGHQGSMPFDSAEPVEIDVEPIWSASADGSRLVRDAPGVTVDAGGIPLRHRSAISYPYDALAQGIEGTVVTELTLDWDGTVKDVKVLSGPGKLAGHVIQTVSIWHYAEHVGHIKPRRVSVTFSLADAKRALSPGDAQAGLLADNTTYAFWGSGDSSRRFTLKKLVILGLSEDETTKLMSHYKEIKFCEHEELTPRMLAALQFRASNGDRHLHTYFWREGSEISATIAPAGFIINDWGDDIAMFIERAPSGPNPNPVRVSAAEQSRMLISQVPAEHTMNNEMHHVPGIIRVSIDIGEDGRVLKVDSHCPLPLCSAAESAVRKWIYSPTLVNGHAVEVISEADVEVLLPY